MERKQNKTANERKYLLTDVEACTFTFSDGLKSSFTTSPENEIVLVKLIPRTSKVKSFEDKVLANYNSVMTLNELATNCGYKCIRTFTRHFKNSFKQTPYQWLLERKMEEIYSMVLSSDFTITEIALMYEFKSVSHLITIFSKRFGISPLKCRLSNAI